ncbi:hypothetical protein JK182_01585 [Acetobacter okinawensis]|uniref:hypothetical protein n=1 Tax=Acetobacter okinawensis TaxID=1076594 RepID=UPI001BA8236B|nr:hypothetical protein [Acetobacter okinawensis]MBS0987384.1 hypothetical protein [Acetobacter okinawensis]
MKKNDINRGVRSISVLTVLGLGCLAPDAARAQAYLPTFVLQSQVYAYLLSAVRTGAAQTSASAQQVTTMTHSAWSAAASTIQARQVAADTRDAAENLSYGTGQGYKSCLVAPGKATIGSATAWRNTYAQTTATRENGWFQYGGKARDTASSLVGLRHTTYCSQGEKDSTGEWCSSDLGKSRTGGFPAGNSDASVWMLGRSFGAEEGMTGMDYIDTAAPLPTIPATGSGDAETELARNNGIYRGAFVSAARTGLSNEILNGMDDTEADQASEDSVQ